MRERIKYDHGRVQDSRCGAATDAKGELLHLGVARRSFKLDPCSAALPHASERLRMEERSSVQRHGKTNEEVGEFVSRAALKVLHETRRIFRPTRRNPSQTNLVKHKNHVPQAPANDCEGPRDGASTERGAGKQVFWPSQLCKEQQSPSQSQGKQSSTPTLMCTTRPSIRRLICCPSAKNPGVVSRCLLYVRSGERQVCDALAPITAPACWCVKSSLSTGSGEAS